MSYCHTRKKKTLPKGETVKVNPPFLRTPYNYDRNQVSDDTGLECKDPSLTKQADAEDADINTIVRKFNITGQLPQNVRMPTYGDFSGIFDFHTAQNVIRQATESFMAMPADVRAEFHNDPQEFLEFCDNPDNRERARKLGLLVPEEPTPPAPKAADETIPPAPKGDKGDTKDKKGVT